MRVYFTGLYLPFIHRVRELIQMQEKEEEVILIPNEFIEPTVLLYYDEETKELKPIEDIMKHSF